MIRKRSRFCWALFLCLSAFPAEAAGQTVKYDLAFQRWGAFYFPFDNWRWWKAQAIAESGLRPDAVSYCGARGLMQLMPETAKAMGVSAADPEGAIQGGVRYDRQLWDFWKSLSSSDERRRYTFASYNAGPGSIQRAARLAADRTHWAPVADALPKVTGTHAAETQGYVRRIESIFQRLQ